MSTELHFHRQHSAKYFSFLNCLTWLLIQGLIPCWLNKDVFHLHILFNNLLYIHTGISWQKSLMGVSITSFDLRKMFPISWIDYNIALALVNIWGSAHSMIHKHKLWRHFWKQAQVLQLRTYQHMIQNTVSIQKQLWEVVPVIVQ